MRSPPPSAQADGSKQPLKLLLWLTLVCGIFGYLEVGEVAEDYLRMTRNNLHPRSASGEIVFVAIDDRSTQKIGAWPWPRARLAEVISRSASAGAKGVFLQVPVNDRTTATADRQLAEAIERSGIVTLPVRTRQGTGRLGEQASGGPLPMFSRHAHLADISVFYNYQGAVWRAPFAGGYEGQPIGGMAAAISGRSALPTAGQFRIDYSVDTKRIPRIDAADLLQGRVPQESLRGKSVVVGLDGESLGDQVWIPGRGRMGMTYVQMLGAETLKHGMPVDLGFLPALLVALAACCLSLRAQTRRSEEVPLVAGLVLLLTVPVLLETNLIFVDVSAGLVALIAMSTRLAWRRWRSGSLTNPETGLPNLTALRENRAVPDRLLVAARVHNYAEIASTLSDQKEAELVRQIVQRLSVGDQPLKVYQGDEGVFAWFTERSAALTNHLEALHALFRTPVSMGGRPIDVALTFGVELGSSRANASRLASALVAANEAWSQGLRWKYHDPAREEEVSWRLSLLGELDAAIDKGEVWIAYQPQYDLRRNQVIGAEALARWTHPDKGPISPAEFIVAAEQQGRITKLTDFVLDRAVSTAAAINRRGTPFTIAVNISPRLLTDRELVGRVKHALARHQLPPERLTLELTETESLQSAEEGLAILDGLRALGVRIAIDDYGTGLSTLDYLKKIPANEIKIDQSFVKGIKVNRSDLIMVQSTIALAHSLGRSVVAEGVEERATLDQLAEMDCDVAQGFLIGRPMGVRELVQALQVRSLRSVA
ncbi:EAL domain-containing protein [Sphingomonas sp. BN140010]|uniref:EAL domain-containing protein n=1 Tax=Sphingomonas arvum TaxID=2992113 RepID=A0ABT3JEP6_9SPHN|nr:EAL domain-containing protein [Sphingomonas sp. BN140010]MCW3797543.1 EAL domain-containing protein [Sphingomonas sp. BN140010]